jgi:hypothetical protein
MGDRKTRLSVESDAELEETRAKTNYRKPRVEKLKAQGIEHALGARQTFPLLKEYVGLLGDERLSDLANPMGATVDPSAALQRAEVAPQPTVYPTDILSLQRIVGNRSTGRLLQSRSVQRAKAQVTQMARGTSGGRERGLLRRIGGKLAGWNDKLKEKHPILHAIGIGGLISVITFVLGVIIAGVTAAAASGVLEVIGGVLGILLIVIGIAAAIWWIVKKIEAYAREKATKEKEEAQQKQIVKLEEKTAELKREQERIRNLLDRHGIKPKPPPKPLRLRVPKKPLPPAPEGSSP